MAMLVLGRVFLDISDIMLLSTFKKLPPRLAACIHLDFQQKTPSTYILCCQKITHSYHLFFSHELLWHCLSKW